MKQRRWERCEQVANSYKLLVRRVEAITLRGDEAQDVFQRLQGCYLHDHVHVLSWERSNELKLWSKDWYKKSRKKQNKYLSFIKWRWCTDMSITLSKFVCISFTSKPQGTSRLFSLNAIVYRSTCGMSDPGDVIDENCLKGIICVIGRSKIRVLPVQCKPIRCDFFNLRR